MSTSSSPTWRSYLGTASRWSAMLARVIMTDQTGWFLPDDELKFLEHPEDAAKRILHEQLGVTSLALRLDHIESFQGNDRSWHLVFHFVAEVSDPGDIQAGAGVSSLQWFSLGQLPERKDVAHHGWALDVIAKITANRVSSAPSLRLITGTEISA